jgi:glycosyltransferase, group 4 family
MDTILIYGIIFVVLLVAELVYFKIADKFNIIDKPNERSSHSSIVLRGGGIIFAISVIVWTISIVAGGFTVVEGFCFGNYLPFVIGLVLVAGVSFIDDIHSLPDSFRLVVQFFSMGLMFYSLGILQWQYWWVVIIALIVCVGATNIINFMDGVNGITAGYSLAVLAPLALVNQNLTNIDNGGGFIENSLLMTVIIGMIVFCIFNFHSKGRAKCFAGDVGSIGIAFIMLFAIGKLIMQTEDITYLIFLLIYGIDGCLTIMHRIMLHENLGKAHRKHAFQLMANELKIGHVKVSLIYMAMQLVVSLGFLFICPNTIVCHWIYLISSFVAFASVYVIFKKRYYHLHEEYLASLENEK